jgi:hypothetical protein
MRSWLETRFLLPFLPFAIDLIVRKILLGRQLHWWELPDLKTFSITGAFFCFLIALDVGNSPSIPSDADYLSQINVLRRRFVLYGVVMTVVFGLSTATDASEKLLNTTLVSTLLYPWLIFATGATLIVAVIEAALANLRYKFDYA